MKVSLFPESYAPWLSDVLPERVSERLATCDTCVMETPSGLTRDPGPFDPTLKCCTYFPFIPNFGLGSAFECEPKAFAIRIQASQKKGVLLPLGLFPSPEQEQMAKRAGKKGFGKKRELLCPFYDTARNACSIWASRPGVCITYFCKSEKGAEGQEFWADVEAYLNLFEWTLANAVLWRMGWTEDDIEKSEAVMLTDEPGPERDWLIRSAWQEWAGREEAFFHECRKRALEVKADEVVHLAGDEGGEILERIRRRRDG